MTQQRGLTTKILIGWESAFKTVATEGFLMTVNTCKINPTRNKTSPNNINGNPNPKKPLGGNRTVSVDVVAPLDSIAMWYWLLAAFGEVTTSGTGPYEHEFKIPADGVIPSFTLEKQSPDLSTPLFEQVLGCKVNTIGVSFGGDGELVANINIMGANYVNPIPTSSFDASPTTVGFARIENSQGSITEGGSPLSNARNISFNLNNKLDGDTYVIGSGGIRGALNEQIREVSASLQTLFEDASLMTKALSSTETGLKATYTASSTSIVEFESQEGEYDETSPGLDGPQGQVVDLNYLAFYDDGSEASALVGRITNSEAHA
jgi:hypothetical protein